MIKKTVAVVLTALMAFSLTGCGKDGVQTDADKNISEITDGVTSPSDGGKLELLKQDNKLTQEQVSSRIKAEKLIKSGGYTDDDTVTLMITLGGDSLLESFNGGAYRSFGTVADYAVSGEGKAESDAIKLKQNSLIRKLGSLGLINSVEHTYRTVTNAVAVTARYGDIDKIAELADVAGTYLCDTFNRPQSISVDDVNSIVNNVDVYETGIFNSGSLSQYTGDGTAVAILDSGFDCSHSVFANSEISKPIYTESNLEALLSSTNASETTAGLEVSDVYYSVKIPFKYDYADKDSDVFPYDSEHGTHVAGIIGGYDRTDKTERITGIAKNTQLVLMKVFPDLQEGAETDDILSALEDATLLGVDAINLSLGSSCGFAREVDRVWINEVYDSLKESGISVITAASNSYSSGFGGEQGNTNMVTNPDSATVGSPSTYAASLSVASISGVKSRYLIGNDEQVLFFNESNNVAGDPNNFVEELGIKAGETKTYEYITVPGSGLATSYSGIKNRIKGKIALIRRGDNTFEEKAQIAKEYGAVACIIYNNIDGDILMSMGKSDHIPTISISKDDGVRLAERESGTLKIGYEQQAGPFMSDFSSWGPTPSLGIKPEITAHGGNIKSSVPGGGYDELSGTSMASPNLCGIVILIRQYLKDTYPDLSAAEYSRLCNQLLMSSATIIKNEEGNPYSPRKQGAGLASLFNAVTTKAYITVEGEDRPKLELGDDPERTGEYTLELGVANLGDSVLNYTVSLDTMTESVSTSDKNHVAEKAYMLGGDYTVTLVGGDAQLNGKNLTVNANGSAKLKIVFKLSDGDKNYITSSFPYGMYVEGFVKLVADEATKIDLNTPFLAFYGDWTEAPMFDKTYYEVESQAHDGSIDEEDKLKADYFATTPYGSYFYNYIIPLGTYLYELDTLSYDAIPATEEHIAISDMLGTIDGISTIYSGLLRGAKEMEFTITDKITGEVVFSQTEYNCSKAYSNGGQVIPYFENLKIKSSKLGLVNNRQYEFKMQGKLDYGKDGGLSTNVRNTFAFDFYLDNEAPIIEEAVYEKVYDKAQKKDRYYLTLTVSDNQYVQAISPVAFTSSSSYAFLSKDPIPVYGDRGKASKVRFEITGYLDAIYSDELIGSALAFSIDDYALNSNIYVCQLPGTRGDFRFTSNGKASGRPLNIINANVGDVVDMTQYLYSSDGTLDEDKDYLKYLVWTTYNTSIIKADPVTKKFDYGQAVCLKAGKTQITVTEKMEGKQATVTINVRDDKKTSARKSAAVKAEDAELESVDFIYFETLFAYSRAAQTSEIGDTGDRVYISGLNGGNVSFYPGEKIKLTYAVKPWYVADAREFEYSTSNEKVVKVEPDGTVTALREGSALVTLSVRDSNIRARISITVKSEFVIENRTLIAYKGLGGEVVIPDDEGILYIGSYAFCLYDTDRSIELTDDDYDANKIPSMNTSVTSVIVPHGVEDIQKYAFYNCTGLKSVVLPDSVRFVREYSFCKDAELKSINLGKVEVVGAHAFRGCKSLEAADLASCYAIGASGFEGCSSLTGVDLSHLRNASEENIRVSGGMNRVGRTFKDCTSLQTVTLTENTKLCREMFVNTAVEQIDIYEKLSVPAYAFAKSSKLKKVIFHSSLLSIDKGAFCECPLLESVEFAGNVATIGEQAFYKTEKLTSFTLPEGEVTLGDYCFVESALETLVFCENSVLVSLGASVFTDSNLKTFSVEASRVYASAADGALLTADGGKTVVLAAHAAQFGDLIIGAEYEKIASGAFAGADIESVVFENENIVIGDFAFNLCEKLKKVTFASGLTAAAGTGVRSFNGCTALETAENLDKLKNIGNYSFANTGLKSVTVGDGAAAGEGAFFQSKITAVTVGANSTFGMGAFQNCKSLVTVNMPSEGGVSFGPDCFANDTSLSEIDLGKTDGIVRAETFYGCTSLIKADLANVTEVGNYAFADCSALSSVANGGSVVVIGEGAFSRQTENGSAPTFDKIGFTSVREIGDGAFLGCAGLAEVIVPTTVTKIGDFVFAFCTNLKSVVLPETVTEIGDYAFRSCENLEEINLGNVKTFGEYCFYGATYLARIDLAYAENVGTGAFANANVMGAVTANNLTVIGESAFSKTAILSFTAPALKSIGRTAFYKNYRLAEFTFGSDIEYVGEMAFLGCSSLMSFKYYDAEDKKTDGRINDYAFLSDGVLYTAMPSGKMQLNSVPAGLVSHTLTVPEGVERIEMYAGNRNTNITKIVLPDSLKTIGNYAFNGYTKLSEVEFRSYTAPALETQYYAVEKESDFFPEAKLSEEDYGYGLLHNQFDMFGYELYYFTFKDLAGKFKPIKFVLASNGTEGYGGAVYKAYFGDSGYAERTDYVAMDADTSDFVKYSRLVGELSEIRLSDEKIINSALTALNSMTQSLTDYGYSREEVLALEKAVRDAKDKLTKMQVATAGREFKNVLSKLGALGETFSASMISALNEIAGDINKLTSEERILIANTSEYAKYLSLTEQYAKYAEEVTKEGKEASDAGFGALAGAAVGIAGTASLLGAAAYVEKRRFVK